MLFLSHAYKDTKLVEAIVDAIANERPKLGIRCTSTPKHAPNGGAGSMSTLLIEADTTLYFLGLVTPESMTSAYVRQEFGVRFMSGKPWVLASPKFSHQSAMPTSLRAGFTCRCLDNSDSAEEFFKDVLEMIDGVRPSALSPSLAGTARGWISQLVKREYP